MADVNTYNPGTWTTDVRLLGVDMIASGWEVKLFEISASLQSIATLGTASGKFLYTTGAGTFAEADITTAGLALLDDADDAAQRTTLGLGTSATLAYDIDGTFAANGDDRVPTQKAVKTYTDNLIAANDAMVFKGVINCSTNPNYPAADRGWTYRVSVSGKIGGGSGKNVEAGDILICLTDSTASGNDATVGANWGIVQNNIDGALTTANIGSTVQAYDADLTAIAALASAANKGIYATGSGTWALYDLAAFARTLLDDDNVKKAKATLKVNLKVPNVPRRNQLTASAWLISTSGTDNQWHSVCWAPELGLFVAVSLTGTGNRVMTSPDGITWTARTSAADNGWRGVCWSPELGLLVAVAYSGTGNRVMTSPDGINWTIRTSAADLDWRCVCWSPELSLFVAVSNNGSGNRVMTSPDGINWTSRTSAADNSWAGVCWSPELGLFVAVAYSGTGNRVMTSPDGINWTIRTSAADNDWLSVCWSPELNLFVAVSYTGAGNRVMTSPDGINWTIRTSAADNNWTGVCWAPEIGLFAAVSDSGTGDRVMTSPDGINWTSRTSAANNGWRSACWAVELGLFAAVANSGTGNRAMTSKSANTLTYRSS